MLLFPTKRRQNFFGMKQICLDLRAHYSHLIGYVDFGEQEIRFNYSGVAFNPDNAQALAEFENAVNSLSLVSREIEIPGHIPRPKAQQTVEEFKNQVQAQGYSHVWINLSAWGSAKIEISVLKRDEGILELLIPGLIQHCAAIFNNT